jgi:hypothetical protein
MKATLHELEQVAQWLDSLYIRLQGVELMFSTPEGIEAYNGSFKREEYRASVQQDIEQAVQLGIAISRPMEHCGCLFEALSGDQIPPIEFLLKARSEVNNLSVAMRQQASAQLETVDPFEAHCRITSGSHRDKAKAWKVDHPDDKRTIEQLKKCSENLVAKRNRSELR